MKDPGIPRVLSAHAISRYRQRIDRKASVEEIDALLQTGHLRTKPPEDVGLAHRAQVYAITEELVWPLVRRAEEDDEGTVFLAVTCVRRHKRSKAARRAFREAMRAAELEGEW